jgi:hypothetical protein
MPIQDCGRKNKIVFATSHNNISNQFSFFVEVMPTLLLFVKYWQSINIQIKFHILFRFPFPDFPNKNGKIGN